MNAFELNKKLEELGINKGYYSLNGELNIDAYILYQNYSKWEVFYLDERHSRHDQHVFASESDACDYILKQFLSLIETKKRAGYR